MKKLATLVTTLASTLLLASCSLFPEPTVEELAERVPSYDDATPVNHYALKDITTIGELRSALAGGLDPNGRGTYSWNMDYGSTIDARKQYSRKELMQQRLAFLDVMLRAGGDPQKVAPVGDEKERSIAYALLIRHGLKADEPFTPSPSFSEDADYRWVRYPLNGLSTLSPNIIAWLVEHGAPLNERYCGETLLMKLYEGIWESLVAERYGRDDVESPEERWEKAYAVTQQLLALGVDLSVESEGGFWMVDSVDGLRAIDYIPLAGEVTEKLRSSYKEEDFAWAEKLKQLLLAHGSPPRRASGNFGETSALMSACVLTVSWDPEALDEMSRSARARALREHEEREARLRAQCAPRAEP